MAKTWIVAKHSAEPAVNSTDGCHARVGNGGICPGAQIADWLNSLGDDDAQYQKWPSGVERATNGDVRDNWLRHNDHVVAREPHLARLRAAERSLHAQLRVVEKSIRECSPAERIKLAPGAGGFKGGSDSDVSGGVMVQRDTKRCDTQEEMLSGKTLCKRVCTKLPGHEGKHAFSSWSIK